MKAKNNQGNSTLWVVPRAHRLLAMTDPQSIYVSGIAFVHVHVRCTYVMYYSESECKHVEEGDSELAGPKHRKQGEGKDSI